jgi:THO complex subunit 3
MSTYMSRQKVAAYPTTPPSRTSISPSNIVRSFAWSPLANFVATGCGGGTVRIWDPEKAGVIRNSTELKGHSGVVERVAWNPQQEAQLATCGSDGTVRFWDVRSKASIGEIKIGTSLLNLAWHPNGEELVVGCKVVS